MNRVPLFVLAVVGIGCVPAGSYQGKLVDAISGDPMSDVRLLAKSDPMSSDMGCQAFEAMTGPDGSFTIEGLCAADTYVLHPSLTFMLLDGGGSIDGSVQAVDVVFALESSTEISGRRRIRNSFCAECVQIRCIGAFPLQIFQACPIGHRVEGDIQHMVGFMKWKVCL